MRFPGATAIMMLFTQCGKPEQIRRAIALLQEGLFAPGHSAFQRTIFTAGQIQIFESIAGGDGAVSDRFFAFKRGVRQISTAIKTRHQKNVSPF